MNEEFSMEPERAVQTIPGVCLDEDFRVAASYNHALQRLSAVRSLDGHFLGRRVRPVGGHEAVAELIR